MDFCETATTFVSDPCVGAPIIDLESEMALGIICASRRPVGLQAPVFPARIDPGSLENGYHEQNGTFNYCTQFNLIKLFIRSEWGLSFLRSFAVCDKRQQII